jgi:prepilin-type N-terminal cleavage/methylation domain-containing protein
LREASRRSAQDRTAGFTLLELLVAICVLALLSLSVARGLHLGTDGLTRARQHSAQAARQRAARRLITQLIAGAIPAFAAPDPDDRSIAFAGTAGQIALVTRLPPSLGTPVTVAARMFVEDNALTLAWHPDLPRADGGGPLPETTTIIAADVDGVRFSYQDQAAGWHDDWTGQTALPRAIALSFAEAGWPPLIIEPRANGNTGCVYDPSDFECRRVQ